MPQQPHDEEYPVTVETAPLLSIDRTYGGVYAGTSFEFSERVAAHFNNAAANGGDLLPGEFTPFTSGNVFSIACPITPIPRADFIAAHRQLRVVIDGDHEIRLTDHPHIFATHPVQDGFGKGVPTYVPKSLMPEDFFGRMHSLELFQGHTLIFGPVDRFFHTETSGAVFNQIEDAPGKLVLEVRGNLEVLAQRGEIVFFTDPAFGEPTSVVQVNEDGASQALEWRMLGRDQIGDRMVFNEWVAVGVAPKGPLLVIEVHVPFCAKGLAAALYSGHTRDTAFRADAEVL
jgi:hypothetical protein